MKRLLIVAALAVIAIAAFSCKKCVTCQYEYLYLGDTVTVQFAQECGKTSEINAFKEEKDAEAMRYGTELVCEDTK